MPGPPKSLWDLIGEAEDAPPPFGPSMADQMNAEGERFRADLAAGGNGLPKPFSPEAENAFNLAGAFDMTSPLPGGIGPFAATVKGVGRGAAGSLDLAQPARMGRASEQGYDMSQRFYHGGGGDIKSIDPKAGGFWEKTKAFFLSDNPQVSEGYIPGGWVNKESKDPRTIDYISENPVQISGDGARYYSDGGNQLPVVLRDLDKFEHWDTYGRGYDADFVAQALKEARKARAPGVVFHNMRDPGFNEFGPGKQSRIVAVLKPNHVRSIHAKFDPKQISKPDLLASFGGAGIAGLSAWQLAELLGKDDPGS